MSWFFTYISSFRNSEKVISEQITAGEPLFEYLRNDSTQADEILSEISEKNLHAIICYVVQKEDIQLLKKLFDKILIFIVSRVLSRRNYFIMTQDPAKLQMLFDYRFIDVNNQAINNIIWNNNLEELSVLIPLFFNNYKKSVNSQVDTCLLYTSPSPRD
jgi:hypothetical protein